MAELTVPTATAVPEPAGVTRWVVLRRFLRNRWAVGALVLLTMLVIAVLLGPHLWRYTYTQITPEALAPPSAEHPFGTDAVGHDMVALVLRGAQRSLAVAFIVAFLSTLLGLLVGLIAGYNGGMTDNVLMRGVDLILMMPLIAVLGLVAVRVGGSSNGWIVVSVAISLLFWTPTARVIRSNVQDLRQSDFVESAELIGASTPRILGRHVLPHLVGPIVVVTTTYVAAAIALESTLSFLGLGVQPPDTSLGLLVGQGLGFATTSWWLFYIPGAVIVIIVLLVHIIGDGLQGAFSKGGR